MSGRTDPATTPMQCVQRVDGREEALSGEERPVVHGDPWLGATPLVHGSGVSSRGELVFHFG
jgi:hypothetical protein